MYQRIDQTTTKAGEPLEIGIVTPPDERFESAIRGLLAHKGSIWQVHIESAFRGDTDDLQTRFHVGLIDGEPVANVMTTEFKGVGILGHVFTRPEHRRKGICSEVMRRQMDDFRRRGGRVLLLGTGFESAAYRIYHGFGFRSLRGGFMRYDASDVTAFEADWFARRPARTVDARWKHWPLVSLLAAIPTGERMRSLAWEVFGIGLLEGPFLSTLVSRTSRPAVRMSVLEAENNAVGGVATVHPHDKLPDVYLVDVMTHPNYVDRSADLVASIDLPAGLCLAHCDRSLGPVADALRTCGFAETATIPGLLRIDGRNNDVTIFAREIG